MMYSKPKSCGICGRPFEARANNQKYCSKSCAEIARRDLEAQWYRAHRESKNPPAEYRPRKKTQARPQSLSHQGLTLKEIAVLARAEGLTYGQYVAKYGI